MSFTLDELSAATKTVRSVVPPTPHYRWPLLAEATGAEVWVKHENHTPTGAFKIRGGLTYCAQLRAERPAVRGIVSATRGNHGQSLALAGTAAGLSVVIVVPHGNSKDKNAAMRAFGAELIEHGADFQAAREILPELAEERRLEAVPSFHPDLVVGVATYAAELYEAVPDLDAVYVPVGLGSGICGLLRTRDLLGLRTEVVGVVAANAPAYARSFASGVPTSTENADTFVDGVACRVPDPEAVRIINAGAARVIEVEEDDAAAAMRMLYAATHNIPEPAGALALAGLVAEAKAMRGKRVAVIQTGGNVDSEVLTTVLLGGTPVIPETNRTPETRRDA